MERIGLFAIAILIALAWTPAGAQTNYVAVRGVVRDPQSLGIPATNVKLTDHRTGRERDTAADGHGADEFGGLLPGSYVLEAVSPGFGVTRRQILLEVGEQATLDVMLQAALSLGFRTRLSSIAWLVPALRLHLAHRKLSPSRQVPLRLSPSPSFRMD